jgi:Heavy metal binding domain
MKNFKIVFFSIAFLAVGLTFSSCGNNSQTAKDGKEFTSTYVCPMHCEGSGSEEPGNCPVCGMEYVKKEIHTADGHQHERHKGHDH